MAWKQRIRPCQVGVDPSNRDGVGVNVEDVHGLGADILFWGWSWSQVASAVCVEEASTRSWLQAATLCLVTIPIVQVSTKFASARLRAHTRTCS